jgi:hypothetical protein
MPVLDDNQNLTVRLSGRAIQAARVLAARRSTSVSRLIASELLRLVDEDDGYEKDMEAAFALMKPGFNLGGSHKLNRDELHER